MHASEHRTVRDAVTIVLFLVAISFPLAGNLLHVELPINLTENRRMNDAPSLQAEWSALAAQPGSGASWAGMVQALDTYPSRFNLHYNDYFGFRPLFVRANGLLTWSGFPTASDVVVGRDGWLYLGTLEAIETYRSTRTMTDFELNAWRSALEYRQQELAKRGIRFLVVIAPEKSSIYPEFWPDRLTRVHGESRLDQLLAYLRANTSVEILDLRGTLLAAKAQRQLYYVTDTHWNQYGGFLASQAILGKLHEWYPQVTPLQEPDYRMAPGRFSGDLAGMLALKDVLTERTEWMVASEPAHAQRVALSYALPGVPEAKQPFAMDISGSDLPRVVMTRDSFAVSLIPFLSERFSHAVYVESWDLDFSIVDREQPDVVIQELVERVFSQPLQ